MSIATSCVVIRSFLAGKKLLLAVQLIPHESCFRYNNLYYRVLPISCFLRDISELYTSPNPTDDSRALRNVKFSLPESCYQLFTACQQARHLFSVCMLLAIRYSLFRFVLFLLTPSASRRDACRRSGSLQLYSHSEIRHCTVNRGVYHGRVESVRPWVVGRDDGILLCAACQVLASEIYFEMLESACSLC